METIANFVITYFIGYLFGFLTCIFLVLHAINKTAKVEARVQTKDLYPGDKR